MSELAKRIGLTRQTVSAVLNNRYKALRIKEETAQHVRDEAHRLGYLRNHLAMAVRTGQNKVIGCMITNLAAEYVCLPLSAFLAEASAMNYQVKIEEVYGDQAGLAGLTRLMEQRVSALFYCGFNPSAKLAEVFSQTVQRYNVAAVACASSPLLLAHHIDSDDFAGCELAVDHLWRLGHRRIAYMGAAIKPVRTDGFATAMRLRGIIPRPSFILDTGWDTKRAATSLNDLLSLGKERPTAIFCGNDLLAAAVIREARHWGLRVPEDLSVVGFSGSSLCESLDPLLTSVAEPYAEMGHLCIKQLIKTIKKKNRVAPHPTSELLSVSLKEGNSTAPASKNSRPQM